MKAFLAFVTQKLPIISILIFRKVYFYVQILILMDSSPSRIDSYNLYISHIFCEVYGYLPSSISNRVISISRRLKLTIYVGSEAKGETSRRVSL